MRFLIKEKSVFRVACTYLVLNLQTAEHSQAHRATTDSLQT